jgi:hypothetical protein
MSSERRNNILCLKNIAEYKEENAALRKRVAELEKANGCLA